MDFAGTSFDFAISARSVFAHATAIEKRQSPKTLALLLYGLDLVSCLVGR